MANTSDIEGSRRIIVIPDDGGEFEPDPQLAKNIRNTRRQLGLSQKALAEALRENGFTNWHPTTVSRIENGKQDVTGVDLEALSSVLGKGLLVGTALSSEIRGVTDAYVRRRLQSELAHYSEVIAKSREALAMAQEGLDKLADLVAERDSGNGDD